MSVGNKTHKTLYLLDQIVAVLRTTVSFWPMLESTGTDLRAYNAGTTIPAFTMVDNSSGGFHPYKHPGGVHSYHFTKADGKHGAGSDDANFSFGAGTDVAFSVGAWVFPDVMSAESTILAKYDVVGTLREWNFSMSSSNKIELELFDESIADANAAVVAPSATSLTINDWHFVVATYNGAGGDPGYGGSSMSLKTYLNGADDTGTVAGTGTDGYVDMEDTATPIMLGAADDTATPTNVFDGRIALPFACKRELSAADVLQLYSIGQTLLGI